MKRRTTSTRILHATYLVALGSALAVGAALARINQVEGGRPLDLRDYQVRTIRAERIEIMDKEWGVRMVLTVHDGQPAIAAYDSLGNPLKLVAQAF